MTRKNGYFAPSGRAMASRKKRSPAKGIASAILIVGTRAFDQSHAVSLAVCAGRRGLVTRFCKVHSTIEIGCALAKSRALVLALEGDGPNEQRILRCARDVGGIKIALICLGSATYLAPHAELMAGGHVDCVVVQRHQDHAKVCPAPGMTTMVVPDLDEEAGRVINALLGPP